MEEGLGEAVKEQGKILASGNKPQLNSVQPRKLKKASTHLPKWANDKMRNADDVGENILLSRLWLG